MRLTVKLLAPYCKPGEMGSYVLELEEDQINLQQLAEYLSRAWKDRLAFPLVDKKGFLTAEFMANGRYASLDTVLSEGDMITVIPYVCGG